MGVATAISLGLAAAGAATQIIQGANAKASADKAAEDAANQLSRIQEADKFKALQVPTLGLDLAQQNVQARQAQELQGLRDVGAAGVLGGLTAMNQQSKAEDLALSAQAQEMQYARDQAQAQNAQQIEQNRAQREGALASSRLAGAQTASGQASANIAAGVAGLAQTAGNVAVASLKNPQTTNPDTGLNANGTVTPDQAAKNATNAFAPQIASMKPNVQMQNVGPQLQANQLAGLRAEQGNYDQFLTEQQNIMRNQQNKFDSQYTWDPIYGQWIQKAPY
jgi:hypothetical protein